MFDSLKEKAVGFGSRLMFKAAEKKPEIFLVLGIGTGIAACVAACKSTLKAQEVLEELEESKAVIKEAEESAKKEEIVYTEADKRRDVAIAYGTTIAKTVRIYAPALVLGAISVGCIIAMYKEQKSRILGISAAYAALKETFDMVEKRVKEEEGEEKWNHYRYGTKAEEMINKELGPDGIVKDTPVKVETVDPSTLGDFVFCEATSPEYTGVDYMDETYLVEHENLLTYNFHRDGNLFAIEMANELGIKLTAQQKLRISKLGWVYDKNKPAEQNRIRLRWTKKYVPDYKHPGCMNSVYILNPNFSGVIGC